MPIVPGEHEPRTSSDRVPDAADLPSSRWSPARWADRLDRMGVAFWQVISRHRAANGQEADDGPVISRSEAVLTCEIWVLPAAPPLEY